MTSLLRLDSSINGERSVSRQLTGAIVDHFCKRGPISLTERDLVANPLPPFTAETLAGFAVETQPPDHGGEERLDRLVLSELLAADILIIGAPMYNFTIPSQLKSWIDHVTVAGKTFRYTEDGPEGLLGGKRVIIASSRGNFYRRGQPQQHHDHQETYLETVMGFLGITDLRIIRAEGLAALPEQAAAIVAMALDEIEGLSLLCEMAK